MVLSKEGSTALKGLAILLMLWHHLFLRTDAYGNLAHQVSILGKVCVSLFLFVSGYGLATQYRKIQNITLKTALHFLVKRYLKFFLSYWFCFAIVLIVGYLVGQTPLDIYPPQRNTLKCLISDFFGQMGYSSYLSNWWFNKLIIQLYLIFPLLYLLIQNRYIALVSLAVFAALEQFSILPFFCIVEGGLFAFFIGMTAANYQSKNTPTTAKTTSIIAALILALLILVRFKIPQINFTIIDGGIALCIAALIAAATPHYSFPILRFFGLYATTIYLTHDLVQRTLHNIIYYTEFAPLIFITMLGLAWTFAYLVQQGQTWTRYTQLQSHILHLTDKVFH